MLQRFLAVLREGVAAPWLSRWSWKSWPRCSSAATGGLGRGIYATTIFDMTRGYGGV